MYYICNVGITQIDEKYTIRYLEAPIDISGDNLAEMCELFIEGIKDYLYEHPELINKESTVLNLFPGEYCLQIPIYLTGDDEYYEL